MRLSRLVALATFSAALAGPAQAHGFGQRFDLPLPLWLYISGAGLTVALSFLILALAPAARRPVPVITLLPTSLAGGSFFRSLLLLFRLLALALYLLVILAGLIGPQNPVKNLAPPLIWGLWWVGMIYVSAFVGDLWALLNPLASLFRWFERAFSSSTGRPFAPPLSYPVWLGVWPAAALLMLFSWIELNWPGAEVPASLATLMLAYSALSWLGMALFGRAVWLQHGELFSVLFALFARFAPLHGGSNAAEPQLCLRPPGEGLLVTQPLVFSKVVLVMMMLATVSFDGLMETEFWLNLNSGLAAQVSGAADQNIGRINTAALILAPLLFLAAFLACCRLMRWVTGSSAVDRSTVEHAGLFALTLVPIAIAYHLAHYLSFLGSVVQYLIPLASDPLGLGWDLFGTRLHFIRVGIVDAKLVWYVSLASIVLGHVAAVYLAHRISYQIFTQRRDALLSQIPMLCLMIGYTMLSLWILAQPIVVM